MRFVVHRNHHRYFTSRLFLLSLYINSAAPFQIFRMSSSTPTPTTTTRIHTTSNDTNHNDRSKTTIKLHHRSNTDTTQLTPSVPPTLFLHGLDSSSHTWEPTLSSLGYPGVAVDQRGCGASDLGDPDGFDPDALVEDLVRFVRHHEWFRMEGEGEGMVRPFVMVGHSMGGRIAMSYAAKYPQHILALVIEDMDIRRRPLSNNHIKPTCTRDEILSFDRTIIGSPTTTTTTSGNEPVTTEKDVIHVFKDQGYSEEMVRGWIRDGRISFKGEGGEEAGSNGTGGYYYSGVNPAFRLLCYEQFFDSDHGEVTWEKLGTICASGRDSGDGTQSNDGERNGSKKGGGGDGGFPCHVMVAGAEGTVCDEESITRMEDLFGGSENLVLHRYPNAYHSIHNTDSERFLSDLREIINAASLS